MSKKYNDNGENIGKINTAKSRLLELESVEKTARALENKIEEEAHFINRHSVFLIIGEITIVLFTVGEIYYYLTRNEPLGTISFLSILTSIGIAGFLFWRLDGWRRVKRNKKKLRDLKERIENEQIEAEKIID